MKLTGDVQAVVMAGGKVVQIGESVLTSVDN